MVSSGWCMILNHEKNPGIARIAGDGLRGLRAKLPGPSRQVRGPLPARQPARPDRARDRPAIAGLARPAVRDREPPRRHRGHRHGGGGARRARRPHDPDDDQLHPGRGGEPLQEAAIRPGSGFRADHANQQDLDDPARPSGVPGAQPEGLPFPLALDIPAIGEEIPGYEVVLWYGLVAPAGTPRAAIGRIYDAVTANMDKTDFRARFAAFGVDPAPLGPDQFGAYIKSEIAKWSRDIRQAGIQPE